MKLQCCLWVDWWDFICICCIFSSIKKQQVIVNNERALNVVSLSCQASLNSSMDSLKAELNTALQCDREAEEEVKKLKVRRIQGIYQCAHNDIIIYTN